MLLKSIQKIRYYHSTLGISGAIVFVVGKLFGVQWLFKTNIAGMEYPLYVRIGTTDISVLRQVLVEKHYDFPVSVQPKVIIDAGANIGLSAVFFANKYPESIIIAVEPEASNFQLLQKNVSPYPRIKPLNAALWRENGQISLIDPKYGHHGFQTVEKTENGPMVQAVTVDALMTMMGLEFVDILKIDIEGSEKEVFESSEKWIDRIGMIMAELHDILKPGCTVAFQEATTSFQKESFNGETVVRMRTSASQRM
jgi:FkbM family methyltransferase